MGWLDKAKIALGIIDPEDVEDDGPPRAQKRVRVGHTDLRGGDKAGRPSLEGIEAAPQETLEDVLELRETGDREGMRALLSRLDRGRGLRVVLRAAAALEDGDEAEVAKLLKHLKHEAATWKLPLQLAAALDESHARRAELKAAAESAGAPAWALHWMALSGGDTSQREALVELLFADRALACTIAARDLAIPEVAAVPDASKRYVSFAHGRDCIRRFGAEPVLAVFDRATS